MASLELSPLSEHFDEDQIAAVEAALAEADSSPLDIDQDADVQLVAGDLDDALFAEFMDLLDKADSRCDVYVPPDFENTIEVDDYIVGSAPTLLLALEDMREELDIESVDDDEEEIDEGSEFEDLEEDEDSFNDDYEAFDDLRSPEMKRMWELMYKSARACVRRGVCLFVRT